MSVVIPSLRGAIAVPEWAKNELWRKAHVVPSLDLRFAENKSLVDATTGTNLVDFSRASSGTYVGSDGLIKRATTNLLLQSEDFSATWTAQNGYSVTANQAAAPDGTITADAVSRTNASTQYLYQNVTASGTFTFSCWVRTASGSATFRFSSYNATDGAKDSADLTATTTWQRFSLTVTQSGATTSWYPCNGAINTTFYIWGAQLEQSSTVGEYIKTTSTINSAPRFDHDPTTGESLGLLVEEQRVNLLQRTEEFNNLAWLVFGSTAIAANEAISPRGTSTADVVTISGSGAGIYQNAAVTPGTSYTASVYVRLGTLPPVDYKIAFYDNTTSSFIAQDVTPNQLVTTSRWVRISHTIQAPAGCTSLRFYPFRNSASVSGSLYLWGAQLEAGAFPTSYIKNIDNPLGATRAADVVSISGSNFSSWYRQDQGSIFLEHSTESLNTSIFVIDDATANNSVAVFNASVANAHASTNFLVSGVNSGRLDAGGTFSARTIRRTCLAFASADRAFAGAGSPASQITSPATLPTMTRMAIPGSSAFAGLSGSRISRLTYWPQRLSDEVLQRITQ